MSKITLQQSTTYEIAVELESIPEKYQKPFNSIHEGLGVLREEYIELEQEIFFGEKKAIKEVTDRDKVFNTGETPDLKALGIKMHKNRIRKEAIQVAAMACRIIQELT